MPFSLRLLYGLLLLAGHATAQNLALDPRFQPARFHRPASVQLAVQQADGKRLLLGDLVWAGRHPSGPLTRLLANSEQPDSVFQANVRGLQGTVQQLVLAPGGRVLLVGADSLMLGGITRQRLLLLNADGTPDASFNAGRGAWLAFSINHAVAQPDGKLVLAGSYYAQVGGTLLRRLVRLNADGSLDTGFQTALGTGFDGSTNYVALQPDGKLVVGGDFRQVNGLPRQTVARLLPSGAVDATFTPQVSGFQAYSVAIQADGKILLSTFPNVPSNWRALTRLLPSGAVDATFQAPASLDQSYAPVLLQPDGRIIVRPNYQQGMPRQLIRLLPSGAPDASLAALPADSAYAPISSVQTLPNGQLLVATGYAYGQPGGYQQLPTSGLPPGVSLLAADGSRVGGFAPRLRTAGSVNAIVQLPSSDYLVGGSFTEINGQPLPYLARLSATGQPDLGFSANLQPDGAVNDLLLQPDGAVLVGGEFRQLGGSAHQALARLLPAGTFDAGFVPPFQYVPLMGHSAVERLGRLPDGRVLAFGMTMLAGATANDRFNFMRLLDGSTGQPDRTFPSYVVKDLLVQPDGKVLLAGGFAAPGASTTSTVWRILPTGQPDATFTPLQSYFMGPVATNLAFDTNGDILVGGYFPNDVQPATFPCLQRLPAAGRATATAMYLPALRLLHTLAVQPNGRILLGGRTAERPQPNVGMLRYLSNFRADSSLTSSVVPTSAVNRLLVQADGAIMVAGSFVGVGGQDIGGLVRLIDATGLRVTAGATAPATQAWPVPARGQLHLSLEAAARPSRVELLDALGRPVLHQPATAELTLDTSALPAGAYVLRVHYASGPVTRRVVVE